ncbi:stress response protein SCP2 [Sphingomonas zeicaulis]|uniref:VWA domain-containing protein n=1 Tax=Sphingomonas zeicaulis TaxID=1632740 RepID=UPI003D208611
MQLSRGANAPVPSGTLDIAVTFDTRPARLDVDISAYLLDAAGKVRGDADMIFYNQPASPEGGVRLDAAAGRFAIDPARLPAAIERIAICVVVDGGSAGSLGAITLAVSGGPSFRHDVAGTAEAAIIVADLYLRQGQWKLRAVGQGFAGGLGPLARSFGIDVADEPPAAPASPAAPPASPKVDLHKAKVEQRLVNLEKQDKKLVSLAKAAGVSLAKQKGAARPAKVWLILDVSGSMRGLFKSGAVDRLAQRALAYGLNLDDDGEIGVILFDHRATMFGSVNAGNYQSFAKDIQKRKDVWGTTDYGNAMQMLRETAAREGDFGRTPVYVIFVTDGGTENRKLAEQQIKDASGEAIFWKFMAIGPMPSGAKSGGRTLPRGFDFLAYLDDMPDRVVDNADFFAVEDPDGPSDIEFFDLMSTEYGGWLEAATRAGVLKG